MIRKKERPDLAEIDIPLASTGAIDKKKLSESELKRRREHIKRFLFTFISVTLVLIAVGAILFLYSRRDRISSRSIKTMWNSFWGIEISSETLDWNLTDEAAFAPFQGGVVAADVTGVRSLGADGIEVTVGNESFPSPVLSVSSDRFLLFDKTTHALLYSDGERELLTFDTADDIRSASLSEGGVTVITGEEGYLSAVRAYDRNGALLVEYRTPDYFGVNACLSADQKTLVFLGVSASEIAMESSALMVDIQSSKVASTLSFGESLPLGLTESVKGGYIAVFDDGVRAFSTEGELAGSYAFGGMELHSFAFGEDFAVCVLRRHLAGERFAVMTFDGKANVEASRAESREPVSLAAAGRLVGLSFGNTAEVYPASLSSHTDFTFESYVDKLAIGSGGAVVTMTDGILHVS